MKTLYLGAILCGAAFAHEHGAPEPGRGGRGNGVVEARKELGIRLAPEARVRFGLEEKVLSGPGPWRLPAAALVTAGDESLLYRVRDGFYQSIEIAPRLIGAHEFTVASPHLKPGDQVVVKNPGFLRVAEIATFGGTPAGHAH